LASSGFFSQQPGAHFMLEPQRAPTLFLFLFTNRLSMKDACPSYYQRFLLTVFLPSSTKQSVLQEPSELNEYFDELKEVVSSSKFLRIPVLSLSITVVFSLICRRHPCFPRAVMQRECTPSYASVSVLQGWWCKVGFILLPRALISLFA